MDPFDEALLYITCGRRILVLRSPDRPDAPARLPCKRVAPGQDPLEAAVRAGQEVLASGSDLAARLGARLFGGEGEIPLRRRHFYHLSSRSTAAAVDSGAEWVDLDTVNLAPGHKAFASELAARGPFTVLLGTAQDGGIPQAGCSSGCCLAAWAQPCKRRLPACVGLVDPDTGQSFLIDATPAFAAQLRLLGESASVETTLAGVLLTHAHMGHYTGLMHLGREGMNTHRLPVYAMPRMRTFLRENRPWSHLVERENIALQPLEDGVELQLTPDLSLMPLSVPHRDEDSETAAFIIRGSRRSALYIPDIDAWEAWEHNIESVLEAVDVAWLDGTFYSPLELPGRDPAQIPHPCIAQSLSRFAALCAAERAKIHFLHLNHSNPAADFGTAEAAHIRSEGFSVAEEGVRFFLS